MVIYPRGRTRAILERRSPDFQTAKGYPVAKPGNANMAMSTNQLAERYGAERIAGLRDSVVLETKPGRIEAILLAPGSGPIRQAGEQLDFDPASPPAELRATVLLKG